MKNAMKFLSVAALALMGAILTGCSSEDSIAEQPKQPASKDNVVTLTTTVSFGEGTTRAIDANGHKTFSVGDQIDVVYVNTSDNSVRATSLALTTSDITNDGKTAKFTVTFTNPKTGTETVVKYFYPSGRVDANGNYSDNWLNEQDGSLAGLSSNEDFSYNLAGSWNGVTLPALTLTNYPTIAKFTVKNNVGTDITSTITNMTLNDGTHTYTITPSSQSNIWVAMRPFTDKSIKITATAGTDVYEKTVTGKSLAAGDLTPINLKMNKQVHEGYTAVDYLESTGTQYIDTKLACDFNDHVEIDFMYTESQISLYPGSNVGSTYWKEGGSVFGAHGGWKANGIYEYCIWWHGQGLINKNPYTEALFAVGTIHNVKITSSETAVIDGVKYTTKGVEQDNNNNADYSFALFANYSNLDTTGWKYFSKARIYGCKIWDSSDVLLRNFVPCKRDSDSKPGMYDLVNNEFYPNEGSGDFVTP